ncbi:GntR family transcriptional regulator [uncultured Cohaesibacter sp.]|uniref:GntR family transcriptional regulator n=1 Tax=uncultured Cohaesibacter sp. TaxID=1002546 RepID=UPI0029C7BCDF|nr:GntR family transcriptional regulator [uncultured Cohaesibacter sp.]
MAQIVRRTTTSIVADELRQRILSGQLKEGEQVNQEAIASELGVSRIPVREALQQLEAEGLITLVSHKGAEVTRLEPEEIEELFDVRGMLECWLFEKALPHLSEADLTEAEEAVAAMRGAKDFQSWSSQNWRFHEIPLSPVAQEGDHEDHQARPSQHRPICATFDLGQSGCVGGGSIRNMRR